MKHKAYHLLIHRWSATDYAYIVNNNLGYVSDCGNYWEFDTIEDYQKFLKYASADINTLLMRD